MFGLSTLFWFFWIVAVPLALLIWMTIWTMRNDNRDRRAPNKA